MDEKKDYERPYFKKYRALVDEIEKLPASEQQTKVVNMFHEFYKDMRDSLELASGLAARYIAKTASKMAELIRLQSVEKEQAERIRVLEEWIPVDYGNPSTKLKYPCDVRHNEKGTMTHWRHLPKVGE